MLQLTSALDQITCQSNSIVKWKKCAALIVFTLSQEEVHVRRIADENAKYWPVIQQYKQHYFIKIYYQIVDLSVPEGRLYNQICIWMS